MDVCPRAAKKSLAPDGVEEAGDGSVKQDLGRLPRREPEVDVNGVSLVRTDPRAIGREGEALLVARRHDVLQLLLCQRLVLRGEPAEQCLDIGPSRMIELDPERGWLVTKGQAEELRDTHCTVPIHSTSLSTLTSATASASTAGRLPPPTSTWTRPETEYAVSVNIATATVGEVTAAIDEARAGAPGGAIAFDGDGTLWSGDIGEDFFVALLERELHDDAHEALAREAAAASIDTSGTAREIAHRLHAAYLAGTFSEERICEIIAWAPAGWSDTDLDRFCEEVVVRIDLRARLHREALRVVEHARRAGVDVYLVSASPRPIVEAAARIVGIDLHNVTAVREVRDERGIVRTDVHRPIPYGEGKVTRLREMLGPDRPLYAAFGDNAFDVPMLREAAVSIAIRPKERLLQRAAEVPGLRTLARE